MNYRGKSQTQRAINLNFEEYKQKDIDKTKKRNYNRSAEHLEIKINKKEYNIERSIKTDINNYIDKKKEESKKNESFSNNYTKCINTKMLNNYSYAIPINKTQFNNNKLYYLKNNGINPNKNQVKKGLIKNYSDYSCNIINNIENGHNSAYANALKYPTLKNLFNSNIFPKYSRYKIKINRNNSNNVNALITNKTLIKNNIKEYLDYKINDANKEVKEKQNSSVEKYLNKNYNLENLDSNSNIFSIYFKLKNPKRPLSISKNIKLNEKNKFAKENNSENKLFIKHSHSFINNNNKLKDYISTIKGYRRAAINN